MTKRSAKVEKILDVALELLKNAGDYGVSMRQVASLAGMSLSNLQYYFKNKDELLKAMADRYFQACLKEMEELDTFQLREDIQQDVRALLGNLFAHGLEVSEMCRIFREYWAISTRNQAIEDYLQQYYRDMHAVLSEKLRPVSASEQGLSRAVSVIIPFTEGYSITALAMPDDINRITDTLTTLVIDLLQGKDE